ncbi:MAG: PhzF family phenazine biosynthesis protein [Chitinivibrionales bacterium]|nr:PhzF family phenazine biosynthesis protein [Chitinivibrionales bacterium]
MKIYHVDAFTEELFKGNSAGVCILKDIDIADELKKKIARELQHSETAFVLMKDGTITLRWFTPEQEVSLCGHATLSAAHVLFESQIIKSSETIPFQTKSGTLYAAKRGEKIELDFPQLFVDECEENQLVNTALGIKPLYTGKNHERYLLEIDDPDQLRNMEPDFESLKKADRSDFMVTCRSDRPSYDFLSRFFAPGIGIPEDPVTGSAHCYLAPYWAQKLKKNRLTGFQESGRTGVVGCELVGIERVKLLGSAVIFYKAELNTIVGR